MFFLVADEVVEEDRDCGKRAGDARNDRVGEEHSFFDAIGKFRHIRLISREIRKHPCKAYRRAERQGNLDAKAEYGVGNAFGSFARFPLVVIDGVGHHDHRHNVHRAELKPHQKQRCDEGDEVEVCPDGNEIRKHRAYAAVNAHCDEHFFLVEFFDENRRNRHRYDGSDRRGNAENYDFVCAAENCVCRLRLNGHCALTGKAQKIACDHQKQIFVVFDDAEHILEADSLGFVRHAFLVEEENAQKHQASQNADDDCAPKVFGCGNGAFNSRAARHAQAHRRNHDVRRRLTDRFKGAGKTDKIVSFRRIRGDDRRHALRRHVAQSHGDRPQSGGDEYVGVKSKPREVDFAENENRQNGQRNGGNDDKRLKFAVFSAFFAVDKVADKRIENGADEFCGQNDKGYDNHFGRFDHAGAAVELYLITVDVENDCLQAEQPQRVKNKFLNGKVFFVLQIFFHKPPP